MTQAPLAEQHEPFVAAAKLHSKASTSDPKVANAQYGILKRISEQARDAPHEAPAFYGRLMRSSDPSVRRWAAAHSLGLGIEVERATAVLEEQAQDRTLGIFSLDAKMTLRQWRERGTLTF